MRAITGMVMALGICVLPSLARAHVPHEAAARVSSRDGQVVIELELDLLATLDHMGGTQKLDAFRDIVVAETTLRLDGERVPLELRSFPTPEALERAAITDAIRREVDPHAHAVRQVVRLRSTSASPGAQQVTLSLPPLVGSAFISFDEPQTRLVPPGSTGRFSTRAANLAPPTPAVPPPSANTWQYALIAFLAGAGASTLVARRIPHRRPRTE